ncbi:MAG: trypsin-like peptidase domain-containing protein [Oscillospiraceae bacterium]|nr:trypsin-like peptidase domain-containing protein [Oscillospiraceae bacterium]
MYNDDNNFYRYSARDNGGEPNPYMRESVRPDPNVPPVQPAVQPKPPKKKRSFLGLKITALALCCAILGGLAGAGAVYFVLRDREEPPVSGENQPDKSESEQEVSRVEHVYTSEGDGIDTAGIYDDNVSSTVSINCSNETTNYFGQVTETASSGSGFVITTDGYIVTNYHVIKGADSVEVMFDDETSYAAQIVGGDEDFDIAVIKIEAENLRPVALGDSDEVQVGDNIAVIGNPLGELSFSMSRGIVSMCNRAINVDGTPFNMIQIDASVNPGNSGGPLFNAAGEVIGIVSAKYSTYSTTTVEGLGFAIPINDVHAMISDIVSNGYVTNKPYFAITGYTINAAMAEQEDLVEGVYIFSVDKGGAAEEAGLRVGDVITMVDDLEIKSLEDLTAAKKSYSAGDKVTLKIYRDGDYLTVDFTFDSTPKDSISTQEPIPEEPDDSYYDPGFGFDIFDYFFW